MQNPSLYAQLHTKVSDLSKLHECLYSGIEAVALTRIFPYIFNIWKNNKVP